MHDSANDGTHLAVTQRATKSNDSGGPWIFGCGTTNSVAILCPTLPRWWGAASIFQQLDADSIRCMFDSCCPTLVDVLMRQLQPPVPVLPFPLHAAAVHRSPHCGTRPLHHCTSTHSAHIRRASAACKKRKQLQGQHMTSPIHFDSPLRGCVSGLFCVSE